MTRHGATPAGDSTASKAVTGVFATAGLIAVVTLAARVFGFGRWLVFSQSVGTTCVGSVYQAANQLPNVIFEVAAGGALAAVVVPIIAGQLARRNAASEAEADRTASAMLTWTLAVLVPLSILLAACARPLSTFLVDDDTCAGSTDLMASMLMVFSPQIALYGVGIVLAGVLQAHRRFLGVVVAPLLSSLVVMATYLLFGALAQGRGNDLVGLPGQASAALAVGTTLGVAALSLPLLIPVHRAGVRLRPTWGFPDGVARRASVLAGAGLLALVAQQVAVLVTLWVSQHRGGTGTLNVYMYVQAVYLLPYAVLAVPVAMSALPALATGLDQATLAMGQDQGGLDRTVLDQAVLDQAVLDQAVLDQAVLDQAVLDQAVLDQAVLDQAVLDRSTPDRPVLGQAPRAPGSDQALLSRAHSTLASSARAIIVATSAGAAVLFAIAVPTGAFFSALDAGRHSPAGQLALAALPAALSAFAPGLVGFGMAALLTRALYVQGRPAVAGGLVALGWAIAALGPLLILQDGAGPRDTLLLLGLASSFGMTVAAVGLFVAVRRAWGASAFRGFGRTAVVALGAGAASAIVGRSLAAVLHPEGLLAGAVGAVLAAVVVVLLCAALIWMGDRQSALLVLSKLPGQARAGVTRRGDAQR
jgi:putative peptidoglycan lipid II flippase